MHEDAKEFDKWAWKEIAVWKDNGPCLCFSFRIKAPPSTISSAFTEGNKLR